MESRKSSIEDNLEFIPERNEYVNSNPDSQEKFSFTEFKVHTNVLDNTPSVADITPEKSFEIGMILKKVGSFQGLTATPKIKPTFLRTFCQKPATLLRKVSILKQWHPGHWTAFLVPAKSTIK